MEFAPVTVVETADFVSAARKLMSEDERMALLDYLARNPLCGDVIPGTGGMRKLRWALKGRGKRGGARVVYYFYNSRIPLFALDAYAKNEKADLKSREMDQLRRVVKLIEETFLRKDDKA